jgi:ubiquitin-activating enzyme E1
LIKLVKGVPLRVHQNAFVNLALPFFAFTSPLPADPIVGMGGKTHTVWDRTIINEGKKSAATGGIKLSELLKKVEKKTGGCVSSLYYGPYMIYADFLHSDDETIAHKSVLELIKEALTSDDELQNTEENVDDRAEKLRSSINVDEIEAKPYIELSGVVEDESTGEDAEIPIIRINRWKECIKQGDC